MTFAMIKRNLPPKLRTKPSKAKLHTPHHNSTMAMAVASVSVGPYLLTYGEPCGEFLLKMRMINSSTADASMPRLVSSSSVSSNLISSLS